MDRTRWAGWRAGRGLWEVTYDLRGPAALWDMDSHSAHPRGGASPRVAKGPGSRWNLVSSLMADSGGSEAHSEEAHWRGSEGKVLRLRKAHTVRRNERGGSAWPGGAKAISEAEKCLRSGLAIGCSLSCPGAAGDRAPAAITGTPPFISGRPGTAARGSISNCVFPLQSFYCFFNLIQITGHLFPFMSSF